MSRYEDGDKARDLHRDGDGDGDWNGGHDDDDVQYLERDFSTALEGLAGRGSGVGTISSKTARNTLAA